METALKFVGELLKLFISLWKNNKAGHKAMQIADMYDSMNSILTPNGVNRILVMWYHNSGGVIRTDKPLYVTCIHEVKLDELKAVKHRYKGMEVDHNYIKKVRDIYVNGSTSLQYQELSDGLLKNIFRKEQVHHSHSYFIKHNKKGLWFVSLRTSNPLYDFTEDEVDIRAVISNVRRTI